MNVERFVFCVLVALFAALWVFEHARYVVQRNFALRVIRRGLRTLNARGVSKRRALAIIAPELSSEAPKEPLALR